MRTGGLVRSAGFVVVAAAAAFSARVVTKAASVERAGPELVAAPRAPALGYERNVGQCADGVRSTARCPGMRVFLLDDGFVLALAGRDGVARLSTTIRGARTPSAWNEGPALPGRSHSFLGNDPSKWRTNVALHAGVRERDVLPGVDLVYGGSRAAPEYRFVVAAGAAFDGVELDVDGADAISVDAAGDLRLATVAGVVRHTRPIAWQETKSGRVAVAARFETTPTGARIVIGPHDASRPLVIDPKVEFATFLLRVDPAPKAASGLTASLVYANSVRLDWTDNSNDEDDFRVERLAPSGGWAVAGEVGANATSFVDMGLDFSTTYSYRVVAEDVAGEARPSNVVTIVTTADVVPDVPTGVSVLAISGAKVRLHWTSVPAFGVDVEVLRSVDGGAFAIVATAHAVDGVVVDDAPPDREVVYRLRARGDLGVSSETSDFLVHTPPLLQPKPTRGFLHDDARPAKDAVKLSGALVFDATASPDGVFDPASDGFALRFVAWDFPVLVSIAPNDPRWKTRHGVATWRSAAGSSPSIALVLDLRRGKFSLVQSRLDLPSAPAADLTLRATADDEAGSAPTRWKQGARGWTLLRQ